MISLTCYWKNFQNKLRKCGNTVGGNISWSTVAPTGSISLLTQTTSGCEPLFSPYYMRRKKVNANDENQRVDFTDDVGIDWQEYPVLHTKFKLWIEDNLEGWWVWWLHMGFSSFRWGFLQTLHGSVIQLMT